MPRIAYVDGQYVPHRNAVVHIEDRGFQFADGVYEVCLIVGGRCWDMDGHMARLKRSLRELRIAEPMGEGPLRVAMTALIRRNRIRDGLIYLQVTRGVARRNHAFPHPLTPSTLVMTARRFDLAANDAQAARGVAVISQEDIRWGRVDIKTVSLLPNCLAKQAAVEAGAVEAWLFKGERITEGGSSNAWIVTKGGELVTHPLSHEILGGITRRTVIDCARELQIAVREEAFTKNDVANAAEAFITSATNLVTPVVKFDGAPVGDGRPGPVASRLREAYKTRAAAFAAGEPSCAGPT